MMLSRMVPAHATAAGNNLIQNGSFEGSATGPWSDPWGFFSGGNARGNLHRESNQPGEGAVAARVDGTTADPASPWNVQLYQQDLQIAAGTPVSLSFMARASSARSIGVAVSGTNYHLPAIDVTTGWQSYSYSFTPTGDAMAALTFNFAQVAGSIWLDAVSLTQGTSASPPASGGSNALANGSFEGAATGPWSAPWDFSADSGTRASLNRDTAQPGEGAVAARIDVTSADPASPWNVQLYQKNLSVCANTPLTVSFLARASKGRSIGLAVNGTNYQVSGIALTTGWQSYSYSFTSTWTTAGAALTFTFAQDTGSVWLDAVAVTTGSGSGSGSGSGTQTPKPSPTPAPTPPPSGQSIYLGVTQHPAPWNMGALNQFEQDSGKKVAIVSYFIGYQANNPPERGALAAIQARGSVPMITWEWQQTNLSGILTGAYDNDARLWARELKAHGGPVLLRWGHEMNLPWYAWSVTSSQSSQQFIDAWRRLRGIFQQEGATNVQWVWCPNIIDYGVADFTPMYPGDDYVDWVALDGYNWSPRYSWRSFTQLFQSSYATITRISNKPLMIAEWGSTEQGGDKGAWLRSALTTEIPTSFPRIKALVYFNQNYQEDWRIESSENARRGYADGIAGPLYRSSWP
jgi:hypothetical protein